MLHLLSVIIYKIVNQSDEIEKQSHSAFPLSNFFCENKIKMEERLDAFIIIGKIGSRIFSLKLSLRTSLFCSVPMSLYGETIRKQLIHFENNAGCLRCF